MDTPPSNAISTVLFGKTRRNVLSALFTRPDEWIHLRQVARFGSSAVGPVQRELIQLASCGLIERESRGNQIVFRANAASPVYAELSALVVKTMGVGDVVRQSLAPLADRIRAGFVYGSFARGEPQHSSDVDVFLVGSVSLREVVIALQNAQTIIAREVNPTIYSVAEFAEKLRTGHHFVTSVVNGPKIFLLGDEHELKRLAKERLAQGSHPKPERNQATDRRRAARPSRLRRARAE